MKKSPRELIVANKKNNPARSGEHNGSGMNYGFLSVYVSACKVVFVYVVVLGVLFAPNNVNF